jgi:hypothetical protein
MRLFGRYFSRWWLLLLLPCMLLAAPALLMLFFMGNNLAGAIFGPPAIWNRPWDSPSRSDMVGRYSESSRRVENTIEMPKAHLALSADGSMIVTGLPYEFINESCVLSGNGTWRGPDSSGMIDLDFVSDGAPGSCKSSSYSFLEVTTLTKPHNLYWVIGDPDSGIGVSLARDKE